MQRFTIFSTLAALTATVLLSVPSFAQEPTESPADRYKALVEEFEEFGGAKQFAEQFLQLAEQNPKDPIAVNALLWIVKNLKNRPEAEAALKRLETQHLDSEKLGPGCRHIAGTPSVAAEQLLRACIERSPHRKVQAEACYALATLLEKQLAIVEQMKQHPELADRIEAYYGKDYGEHLASLNREQLSAEIESTYERMIQSFADVGIQDLTMGDVAKRTLFRIQHLSLGRVAPETEGEDIDGKPLKLSDYRGKVVMLSFWGHW